jgi:hypothetical protein
MTMTTDPWYEIVAADVRLTQGDLIFDCPLLAWDDAAPVGVSSAAGAETLKQAVRAFRADVVVMSQACDLEHDKVRNVVLCPHIAVSIYRSLWEEALRRTNQNPTAKAWRNTCDDIADGYVWNLAFLNGTHLPEGSPHTELRVVDFHDLFTVPRAFLETLSAQRQVPRLRLRPPYREHLSQAFARFFMRVGLPTPVEKLW